MEASQAQEFSDAPSNACTSACTSSLDSVQTDAALQHVIDALAMLAEVDRDAVVAHVRALVSMSPKRRDPDPDRSGRMIHVRAVAGQYDGRIGAVSADMPRIGARRPDPRNKAAVHPPP